jgi:hypothetical protein
LGEQRSEIYGRLKGTALGCCITCYPSCSRLTASCAKNDWPKCTRPPEDSASTPLGGGGLAASPGALRNPPAMSTEAAEKGGAAAERTDGDGRRRTETDGARWPQTNVPLSWTCARGFPGCVRQNSKTAKNEVISPGKLAAHTVQEPPQRGACPTANESAAPGVST